jgi:hypothetical protein
MGYLLLLSFLTTACMSNLPKFEYADGSANRYIISADSLVYDPVTPEESSTGMYSGGDPKAIALTPEQYKRIRVVFEKAINNTADHMKDRIKTSGEISVIDSHGNRQYILKPGSPGISEIETLLKELLSEG